MRIIIQAYDYGLVGGIARYLDSFVASISKVKGLDVTVLTAKKDSIRPVNGVKVIQLPMEKERLGLLRWSVRCRMEIGRIYAEKKVDFVNLHSPPLIPMLFLSPKARYVMTSHSNYYGWTKHYKATVGAIELKTKLFMERKLLGRAFRIITLTQQAKHDLQEIGLDERKILVYPNGADLSQFKPSSGRKKYDAIFCGRIEQRKGSRAMVKAVKALLESRRKSKVCIVGFGDDEDFVKASLAREIESGSVFFAGKVAPEKVAGYYRDSRVYVSCSYNEGLPGTCIESMASALPTVTWDMYFYKGLVKGSTSGFLVKMDDFKGLNEKILELVGNAKLASRMGREGRAIVESGYSWSRIGPGIIHDLEKSIR